MSTILSLPAVAASREAVPHPYLNTPVVTGVVMLLALVIILTTLALVTMRNKKMRGLFYSFIDYRTKSSTKRGSGLQTTDVGKVSLIKFGK